LILEVDRERLQALRVDALISMRELSRRSGVNVESIRKLEAGENARAQDYTVRALAEALSVEPKSLLKALAPTT
jgi:transcriptional regulator with XRE-family HTH domain